MCNHAPTVISGVECRPGHRDGVDYAILSIPKRTTYHVAQHARVYRPKEFSAFLKKKFENALTLAHLPARSIFEYAN